MKRRIAPLFLGLSVDSGCPDKLELAMLRFDYILKLMRMSPVSATMSVSKRLLFPFASEF